MTARVYGGIVAGDGRVTFRGTPQFNLRADLSGGDLNRFVTETTNAHSQLRGVLSASVELAGSSAGSHTLTGGGGVQLRDGDIYELPLLLSLLKILSVRAPDTKAFSTSDINFKIHDSHVDFDPINFRGDAISLIGRGEMDFNKNVNMKFYAAVGSDRLQVPILRPLLGGVSQQLMEIYVVGSLDNPRTSRQALPGVRRALEGLQEGFKEPPADNSLIRSTQETLRPLVPGGS